MGKTYREPLVRDLDIMVSKLSEHHLVAREFDEVCCALQAGGGVCRRYPLSENSRPLNTLRTLDTVPLSIEDQEQAEVIKWFRATWPEHEKSLRSSMNGLPRHGRQGAILWRIMQRLGCQKGEPDFALLLPKGGYGALVIEHKGEGQSHKLTPEQTHHLEYHESIGNCAVSTRGVESFKAAIIAYMEL